MASRSNKTIDVAGFQKKIWDYARIARRDFPWRRTKDSYAILISEIMLQQTQTDRVIPKYLAWLAQFPSFKTLAAARRSEVLEAWQGLGYNRRAIALQETARIVMADYNGRLPDTAEELVKLPGIGKYTAGAVLAFAFQKPAVFIETNIRRVFIHTFFPRRKVVDDQELLPLIQASLPPRRSREWYYAVMDYGAMLGRTLRSKNPNRKSLGYAKQGRFEGSRRQLRGKVLAALIQRKSTRLAHLAELTGQDDTAALRKVVEALHQEGFVEFTGGNVKISG